MSFPNLRYMQVRNATMSSEQVADFVFEHRHTVREFDFENVFLIGGGTWEDALAPLTRISGNDEWLSQQSGSEMESNSSFQSHDYLEYLEKLEEMDEVIDTVTDTPAEVKRNSIHVTKLKKNRHRRRKRKHRDKTVPTEISAPMPISEPVVDYLQPTIFNPNVQGVQRNVQQEAAQQELADDPEKRVSTLKKAREAVLKQLSKEFCRNQERKEQVKGFFKNTCSAGRKDRGMMGHQSSTALVPLMFSRY
jgi:hypothetical protein